MSQETTEQYLISDAAKQVEVEAHVLRYWEEELKLPIQRNHLGHRFYSKEDIERFCMIRRWKEEGLQLKAIRNALNHSKMIVLPGAERMKTEREAEMVEAGAEKPTQAAQSAQEGDAKQEADTDTLAQRKAAVRRVKGTVKGKGRKAKKSQQKVRILMQNKEKMQQSVGETEAVQEELTDEIISNKSVTQTQSDAEAAENVHGLAVLSEDEKSRKAARFQFLLTQMMKEAVRSNNEELLSNVQEVVVKEMDYQFRQQEEREQEREERRLKREEEHFKKIDSMLRNRREQAAERQKRKRFLVYI